MKRAVLDVAAIGGAIALSIVLVAIGLRVAGYDATGVLREWAVSAGGTQADWAQVFNNACPLIFTGLAAGVAFRCGVFNIGAEGQFLLGSAALAAFATRVWPLQGAESPAYVAMALGILCAGIAGAMWAGVAGVLERWRGVPVVLSTILLNFIALLLLGILLEGPLRTGEHKDLVQSDTLTMAYWLPVGGLGTMHAGIFVAVALAVASWLVQARTAFGFELLTTGLNPVAARLAGVPVASRQLAVMLISGALAGIGGGIQLMGVEGHVLTPTSQAYGYMGIAVALLGRLHPAGIVLAAVFFGLLDRGATGVELTYQLPPEIANIVKAACVLMVLVASAYIGRRQLAVRQR